MKQCRLQSLANFSRRATCRGQTAEMLAPKVDNGSNRDSNLQQMVWKAAGPQMESPTLNLENDEFYGSPRVDKLMPEARIRSPFFQRLSPMISSKHGNIQQRKGSPEAGCQDWFGQKQTFWLLVNHCPSVFSLIISRMRGLGCKFSDITILGFPHL